jgi:putative transcriptional regulator
MISDLAPGILAAAPSLKDPNFAKSIVLMAEHGDDGAVGFMLNKPSSVTLMALLDKVDEGLLEEAQAHGVADQQVLIGGPVQKHIAWVLYRREDAEEELDDGSIAIGQDLCVGASLDTLRACIRGEKPGPFHVLLGYSGWSGQQLEGEIGLGAWLPLGLGDEFVFDVPMEERWDAAIRRLGLVPGEFLMCGSGAEA